MIKVERTNGKLIFRDESNGKFVKPILGDWSKLKEGNYSFINTICPSQRSNTDTLNDTFNKYSPKIESLKTVYTLQLKVVNYYDLDVTAESFEDAISKVNQVNVYNLVTKEIPVDTETPIQLVGIVKQDG